MTTISRRDAIKRIGAFALAGACFRNRTASASARPNILFILTDDQRWDALSCVTDSFLRTPNMDRLAAEGVRFENAFAPTARSETSRTAYMTGRIGLPVDAVAPAMFPATLCDAGYETAFIGKWGVGPGPMPRTGFDYWLALDGSASLDPTFNENGRAFVESGVTTEILTDFALAWLRRPRNAPFCLTLAYAADHAFPDGEDRHPGGSIKHMKAYYRALMLVDDGLGALMALLEKRGELDNTIILLASDTGYYREQLIRTNPARLYDEFIRVPLLLRYPPLAPSGMVCKELVLNADVAPTLLDLVGVPHEDDLWGRSLRPLLVREEAAWRHSFFCTDVGSDSAAHAVRTGVGKYIHHGGNAFPDEYYDLVRDANELNNVAGAPQYEPLRSKLRAEYKQLQQKHESAQ